MKHVGGKIGGKDTERTSIKELSQKKHVSKIDVGKN